MAARDAEKRIREIARERILVLDGAWGTLIHGAGLRPEDYRGTRFASHPRWISLSTIHPPTATSVKVANSHGALV